MGLFVFYDVPWENIHVETMNLEKGSLAIHHNSFIDICGYFLEGLTKFDVVPKAHLWMVLENGLTKPLHDDGWDFITKFLVISKGRHTNGRWLIESILDLIHACTAINRQSVREGLFWCFYGIYQLVEKTELRMLRSLSRSQCIISIAEKAMSSIAGGLKIPKGLLDSTLWKRLNYCIGKIWLTDQYLVENQEDHPSMTTLVQKDLFIVSQSNVVVAVVKTRTKRLMLNNINDHEYTIVTCCGHLHIPLELTSIHDMWLNTCIAQFQATDGVDMLSVMGTVIKLEYNVFTEVEKSSSDGSGDLELSLSDPLVGIVESALSFAMNLFIYPTRWVSLPEAYDASVNQEALANSECWNKTTNNYARLYGEHKMSKFSPLYSPLTFGEQNNVVQSSGPEILEPTKINPLLLVGPSGFHAIRYTEATDPPVYFRTSKRSGFGLIVDHWLSTQNGLMVAKPQPYEPSIKTPIKYTATTMECSLSIIMRYIKSLLEQSHMLVDGPKKKLEYSSSNNPIITYAQVLYLCGQYREENITIGTGSNNRLIFSTDNGHEKRVLLYDPWSGGLSVATPRVFANSTIKYLSKADHDILVDSLVFPGGIKDLVDGQAQSSIYRVILFGWYLMVIQSMENNQKKSKKRNQGHVRIEHDLDQDVVRATMIWIRRTRLHYDNQNWQWHNPEQLSVLLATITNKVLNRSVSTLLVRVPSIPTTALAMAKMTSREDRLDATTVWILCFLALPLGLIFTKSNNFPVGKIEEFYKNKSRLNTFLSSQLIVLNSYVSPLVFEHEVHPKDAAFSVEDVESANGDSKNLLLMPKLKRGVFDHTDPKLLRIQNSRLMSNLVELKPSHVQILMASSIWVMITGQ